MGAGTLNTHGLKQRQAALRLLSQGSMVRIHHPLLKERKLMRTDLIFIGLLSPAAALGWFYQSQAAYERDVWHWKYDLIDPIRAEAGLPLRPFPVRPFFVKETPGVDLPK